MTHILTLDAGTGSLKCSLFDENGGLAGACTAEYPTYYPREGCAEQNAADITSAAVRAIKNLLEQTGPVDIAAVGLTGTMNGCLPLDEKGNVLYPNMIHLDTRATAEAELLRRVPGTEGYYARTGNRPDVHYGLPKLMWLKANEPGVYKKTRFAVNTKDLLYGFLTGIYGRTDYSDASLFGAMNISERRWDTDITAAAGIDINKLPEIFPSRDVSGRVSALAAELTGLKQGTPVAIGAGDGPATTHGSGVYDTKGAYLTVGSSAWAAALCETPRFDKSMRAFSYTDMDERYTTLCGTVQCASTALDYALGEMLGVTKADGKIDFDRAEQMCLSSPAGAKGLLFVPTLLGERCPWWDAEVRGALVGLSLSHTKQDMVRAAYEGVAQELNLSVNVLRENGIPADNLILTGGGVKSGIYRGLFPSVFGAVTRVHATPREATSMGAAMAAGVGAGVWSSYEAAGRLVKVSETCYPDPARQRIYEKQYKVFSALYGQLKGVMSAAAVLRSELGQ